MSEPAEERVAQLLSSRLVPIVQHHFTGWALRSRCPERRPPVSRSLLSWIGASLLVIGLAMLGVPVVIAVMVAAPFAFYAGWTLIPARSHECGWCGCRFTGPYDWVCPCCEGNAQ